MSLGLEIFLKLLSYSLIIIAVRAVLGKIQTPKKEITSTESGGYLINHKTFSIIYLIGAIVFTIIFVFVTTLSSNLEGTAEAVVTGGFVLFILLLFVVSFLFGRAYLKIGKDGIYWRTMCGKDKEARYEDITSFTMDSMGNLKLYHDDECILDFPTFATGESRLYAMEVIKKHKVRVRMDPNSTAFTMRMGIGYVIFDAVCIVFPIILFLMGVHYSSDFLILGSLVFIIGGVFSLLCRRARRITVENNTIIQKRMLRKPKEIKFGEVAYLSIMSGDNTEVIGVHSKTGVTIEIPKYYKNVELFEDIIKRKRWRWQR